MSSFSILATTHQQVADASKRNDKVAALAAALRTVADGSLDEIPAAVSFSMGQTPNGRIGVGYGQLAGLNVDGTADPSLTINDVAERLDELAATTGPGSQRRRRDLLEDLFGAATDPEAELLGAIIGGELRQGALEGVMASAVAAAAGVPVASVQRGAMFLGSLPQAALVAFTGGGDALDAVELQPGTPVQPMLASPAESMTDAMVDMDVGVAQWKLDGIRLQAHRRDGVVSLFTRNLNDITDRLPDVVTSVQALPGGDLVLDGEVMGVAGDGQPFPFQDTARDVGSHDATRGTRLAPFWFDVLVADGATLVDTPLRQRLPILEALVPDPQRVAGAIVTEPDAAEAVFAAAVAAGHEGAVVKDVDSLYLAGRRGKSWRKVKPVHTFDLVVLAAEWGHGRRQGWLSNLHLGARDAAGDFVMVGKTFKGLTDELLAWQTERFLELERDRRASTVYVRPEQVVEIALDGVQRSTRYPGGIALRFARVRRYRFDKPASEADTLADLQALGGS